ncbi:MULTISPECIES: flagellar biosynthetic protein FliO [unclassified Sporosarcina]|uniref:flagellar biosynthetic protein FliO n=1 Tax=unclassified Sporosarcina TaxID=2647733 RepID=UPI00130463FE|nr:MULTISPECIES: flagellar biosynthetic protein FliO [unclassified Sporosarcina]
MTPLALADTDPDISVSDCIGKGKDCEEKAPVAENDEKNITDNDLDEPKGLTAKDYIRTILAFIFVIGLLVWLLRFMNKRNRSFDQNRLMTNLGGVPLGQHKSIQLVKMGSHYFVVGVGENVQLLREIDDPDEIADLLERYDQGNEVQKGIFSHLYTRFFSKAEQSHVEEPTFSQVFSTKMDEIKSDRREQLNRLNRKESDRDG